MNLNIPKVLKISRLNYDQNIIKTNIIQKTSPTIHVNSSPTIISRPYHNVLPHLPLANLINTDTASNTEYVNNKILKYIFN